MLKFYYLLNLPKALQTAIFLNQVFYLKPYETNQFLKRAVIYFYLQFYVTNHDYDDTKLIFSKIKKNIW